MFQVQFDVILVACFQLDVLLRSDERSASFDIGDGQSLHPLKHPVFISVLVIAHK